MGDSIATLQEFPPRRTLVIIIGGLMTGMLLGAFDQTIVATAGPTIISELGGLSLYAWVFSAYILTQTVSMPIFGKLSDLYGRRRFFVIGLAIFMGGSILSGFSQNIDELIVFRAIQGVGSGAFFPVAIATIGVIVPPEQRGRLQGAFASVFGIAAVVGPSAGSYIVEAINWRWIFYINLPLGVVSALLINVGLRESRDIRAKPRIDIRGILVLTVWTILLILGFLDGGSTYPWYSWQEVALFSGAAVGFGAFLYMEAKATEPVLPLSLFKVRSISSSATVAFLRGVSFYGVITFVPLFVQAALGGTIDDGRNVVYAFTIPLIVGTMVGGQSSTRRSYREVAFAGTAIMSGGIFLLAYVTASSTFLQVMEYVGIVGFGVGITFPAIILAIQYSVDTSQIGIASSMAQFMGNLGGTIGLAVLGTIQTNEFGSQLRNYLLTTPSSLRGQAQPFLGDPNLVGQVLATPRALAQVISTHPEVAQILPSLRAAFAASVVPLFWAGFGVSIAALLSSLFMTGSLRQQIADRRTLVASARREELGPVGKAAWAQSAG